MLKKLPIFEALISDEEDGIIAMSLVDYPATEINWMAFDKQEKPIQFAITNDEEHILCGVAMIADTPIYRVSPSGEEYYIRYSKETIKLMAEKWLKDLTHNNIDLMHNGELLPQGCVSLVELFIKDSSKGINPNYLENVPEGSLLCNYKIHNEELWKSCKDGTFQGFSLEGYFTIKETKETFKKTNIMKSIKEKLRALLMSFNNQETDKGNLFYEGDELTVNVSVEDADGNPIADGEYSTDEKIYVIKDSIVVEIKDVEIEEEQVEEVVEAEVEVVEEEVIEEPTVEEEPIEEKPSEIDELKAEIEVLKKQVEEILAKINEPAVEPIVEEFAAVQKDNAFDSKLNKAVRIASKLK